MTRPKVDRETAYCYEQDVLCSSHLAYLRPRDTDRQRWLKHGIRIEPEPTCRQVRTDIFGNEVLAFAVERTMALSHCPYAADYCSEPLSVFQFSGSIRWRSSSVRRSLRAVPLIRRWKASRMSTESFRTAQGIGMPRGRMFETQLRSESTELLRAM